jgi:hypothetical protein
LALEAALVEANKLHHPYNSRIQEQTFSQPPFETHGEESSTGKPPGRASCLQHGRASSNILYLSHKSNKNYINTIHPTDTIFQHINAPGKSGRDSRSISADAEAVSDNARAFLGLKYPPKHFPQVQTIRSYALSLIFITERTLSNLN